MAMRYRVGESTGKHVIRRVLNTGAFAISYEAEDQTGRKVFLKQYKSPSPLVSWYEGYKKHQAELKRRVHGNRQLSERTYEFLDEYEHKRAFIQVYSFIEGGKDLKAYLAEGKMSVEQRFTFASLLLYTLKLFHNAGIVHTDLKPDNIYLMPSEARIGYNLKLIDFDFTVLDGLQSPWDKELANDGMNYCGTPHYMSPEHLKSELPVQESDVFTAAIICCELLTKNGHPFPEDETEYHDAVLSGRFEKPDFIVPETAEISALGDVFKRSLSPNHIDRPDIGKLHETMLRCRPVFLGSKNINVTKPPEPPRPTNKPKTPPDRKSGKPDTGHSENSPKPETPETKRHVRLGLSMKGQSETDWFKITTIFGSHTGVSAVKNHLNYCSSSQFVLRREGTDWFIDPAPHPPKNMVVYNGEELVESHKLTDGDVIALGSRKDPRKRDIEPMVVHLESV